MTSDHIQCDNLCNWTDLLEVSSAERTSLENGPWSNHFGQIIWKERKIEPVDQRSKRKFQVWIIARNILTTQSPRGGSCGKKVIFFLLKWIRKSTHLGTKVDKISFIHLKWKLGVDGESNVDKRWSTRMTICLFVFEFVLVLVFIFAFVCVLVYLSPLRLLICICLH